jgi:uncharacterized membrane-anchored protein YhcB (DUF1043 family)
MIDCVLAITTPGFGGLLLALLAMAAYVFVFGLIIISLIRVARYFKTAGKEQKLLRIEMGKLAEEVHLMRQEIKGDPANRSGG